MGTVGNGSNKSESKEESTTTAVEPILTSRWVTIRPSDTWCLWNDSSVSRKFKNQTSKVFTIKAACTELTSAFLLVNGSTNTSGTLIVGKTFANSREVCNHLIQCASQVEIQLHEAGTVGTLDYSSTVENVIPMAAIATNTASTDSINSTIIAVVDDASANVLEESILWRSYIKYLTKQLIEWQRRRNVVALDMAIEFFKSDYNLYLNTEQILASLIANKGLVGDDVPGEKFFDRQDFLLDGLSFFRRETCVIPPGGQMSYSAELSRYHRYDIPAVVVGRRKHDAYHDFYKLDESDKSDDAWISGYVLRETESSHHSYDLQKHFAPLYLEESATTSSSSETKTAKTAKTAKVRRTAGCKNICGGITKVIDGSVTLPFTSCYEDNSTITQLERKLLRRVSLSFKDLAEVLAEVREYYNKIARSIVLQQSKSNDSSNSIRSIPTPKPVYLYATAPAEYNSFECEPVPFRPTTTANKVTVVDTDCGERTLITPDSPRSPHSKSFLIESPRFSFLND